MSSALPTAVSIIEKSKWVNLVVRVAIEKDGKYLFIQEGKEGIRGLWAFPGGKIDMGESITAAAKREIKEETGVSIELTGFLGMRHYYWDDRPVFNLALVFAAKTVSVPETFPLCAEVMAVEWKTLEEIIGMGGTGLHRNSAQQDIVEMIKSGCSLPMDSILER